MPSAKLVTSIRVDKNLWMQAKIYAIKRGITLTELVEQLLKRELEENKDE